MKRIEGRQLLLRRIELEQVLPLFGVHAQICRDEVDQVARIVDVQRRRHQLIRHVRNERHQPLKQLQCVPRQRFDLDRLLDVFGHALDACHQIGLLVQELENPHALVTLHGQAYCAVGNAHHLMDRGDRADLVNVVGPGPFDLGVFLHDERDGPVTGHDRIDQA